MAPAATFLHRRPLPCRSSYQSCTGDHFPANATTFLHQQLPALLQCLPSCSSNHLPAPAATSSTPAATSSATASTILHQQLPVLHPQLPVLNQRLSSCISRNLSYTSDHLFNDCQSCTIYPDLHQRLNPAPTISIRPRWLFRPTLFRFTICHNKVWPFEATPLFCHSCLVRCQSLIFQKFARTGIVIWPLLQIGSSLSFYNPYVDQNGYECFCGGKYLIGFKMWVVQILCM